MNEPKTQAAGLGLMDEVKAGCAPSLGFKEFSRRRWLSVPNLAGAAGAVSSLRPWMTDAGRFPPEWVELVDETLRRAREAGR